MMKKFFVIAALLLSAAAVFFMWDDIFTPSVSAEELSAAYMHNPAEADEQYLNKKMRFTGTVKAYYKLMEVRNVLELNTGTSDIPVFCLFFRSEDEFTAGTLQEGQRVIIEGTNLGIKAHSYVEGIKLEVDELIPQ